MQMPVELKSGRTAREGRLDGQAAFQRMCAAFAQAMRAHPSGLREKYYTFADQCVCFRVVGSKLAKSIDRPFSHLRSRALNSGTPSLKIDLWDEAETAISYPIEPLTVDDYIARSTWYVEYGFIIGSADDRFIGCQRPGLITWFDRETQHMVGWISDSDQLPLYDRGKPLHYPLILWNKDRNLEVIHAGLVSKYGQGVVFAGKGRAGKTTAILACLCADFNYLGDDYIALQTVGNRSFVGYSLYNSTWMMADHFARFPLLVPHVNKAKHPEREKSLVLLSQICSQRLADGTPIRVIVLPHFVESTTARICPATKGEALFALAPSSIILLPGSGAHSLSKIAQLVEQVPSYWLEMGHDLQQVPHCIGKLLDR